MAAATRDSRVGQRREMLVLLTPAASATASMRSPARPSRSSWRRVSSSTDSTTGAPRGRPRVAADRLSSRGASRGGWACHRGSIPDPRPCSYRNDRLQSRRPYEDRVGLFRHPRACSPTSRWPWAAGRGHEVRMVVPSTSWEWSRRGGSTRARCRGASRRWCGRRRASRRGEPSRRCASPGQTRARAVGWARAAPQACAGVDLIAAGVGGMIVARAVAAKLGVPLVPAHTCTRSVRPPRPSRGCSRRGGAPSRASWVITSPGWPVGTPLRCAMRAACEVLNNTQLNE